jgi:hypothetical protein
MVAEPDRPNGISQPSSNDASTVFAQYGNLNHQRKPIAYSDLVKTFGCLAFLRSGVRPGLLMLCFRNEIGSTTAGIAAGRTSAVLCPRVNCSACLDILLRLLLVAFTLSHALGVVAQRSEAKPLPSTPPDDTD